MIAQTPSVSSRSAPYTSSKSSVPSTDSNLVCRVVQIALAVYLLPALVIVGVIGAVGVVCVGIVRQFTDHSVA